MTIGFKAQFAPKIINGYKIQTMRSDEKDRWKAGIMMHMYTGLRTRNCIHIVNKPCVSTQLFRLYLSSHKVEIIEKIGCLIMTSTVFYPATPKMEEFAINDGFENEAEFWAWWSPKQSSDIVYGKIIHWTDFKY